MIQFNEVYNNSNCGIYVYMSNNVSVLENSINNNTLHGLFIESSQYCKISNNNNSFDNNGLNGIYLKYSDENDINYNKILNNIYGVCLNESNLNNISYNLFDGNGIAIFEENSINNIFIGNTDNDGAPDITSITPKNGDLYGTIAPSFNIDIGDVNFNIAWYLLLNATDFSQNISSPFIYGVDFNIQQSDWNFFGNGTIIIRFYANDTFGNENFSEVYVYKDIIAPDVSITTPIDSDLLGSNAPNFNVIFDDINLNKTWYYLFNESNPVQNSGNVEFNHLSEFAIQQSIWNIFGNGTLIIRFYANDSVGNVNNNEMRVYKDIIAPLIQIDLPVNRTSFNNTPPKFNLTITDYNMNYMWYKLYFGIGWSDAYFFNGNASIDETLWGALQDGTYLIRFYANDSMGNIRFRDIEVIKDASIIPTDDDSKKGDDSAATEPPLDITIIIIIIGAVAGIGIAGGLIVKKSKSSKKINLERKSLPGQEAPQLKIAASKAQPTGTVAGVSSTAQKIPVTELKANIPKDFKPESGSENILTAAELEELRKTEKEVDLQEQAVICVVHKGPIDGAIYLCPKCKTYYCLKCAQTLKEKGEKCWACETDIKV